MMPILRIVIFFTSLLLVSLPIQADQQTKSRQVWLRLRAGPILNGDLVKMDVDTVDFLVKGILQSVPCDDLIGVMFVPPNPKPSPSPTPMPDSVVFSASSGLRPTILYREAAAYTPKAKAEKIEGTVVLQVTFNADGHIADITTIHGLSHGLSDQAIIAAKAIRFIPAMKDGKPVSVRGNLEYAFNLY